MILLCLNKIHVTQPGLRHHPAHATQENQPMSSDCFLHCSRTANYNLHQSQPSNKYAELTKDLGSSYLHHSNQLPPLTFTCATPTNRLLLVLMARYEHITDSEGAGE